MMVNRVVREFEEHGHGWLTGATPVYRPMIVWCVVCSESDALGRGLSPEELQQLLERTKLQRQAVEEQLVEWVVDSARAHGWTEPYTLFLTWPDGYAAPQTVRFTVPWTPGPKPTATQRAAAALADVVPAGTLEWPAVAG